MAGEKERLHWLPVHVNDLTSDEKVLAMSTQEFGAYFRLICAAWKSEPACSIPDDDEVLARLTGLTPKEWAKARIRVLAPWKLNDDGRLYQKRLLEVHADVVAKIEQKREAGKRGGKAKAAKTCEHPVITNPSGARAVLEQRHDFASSEQGSETVAGAYQPLTINQSVSNETLPPNPQGGIVPPEVPPKKDPPYVTAQVRTIYENYPRKVAPDAAYRAIAKALGFIEYDELLHRVRLYCDARKQPGQDYTLTPHPATWFNRGSWKEDPAEWRHLDDPKSGRTNQAGLFGGGKPDPTRVRSGNTSETIAAAMAEAAAERGE
jgi:uncharacterized protein YdaU (DUF1376 family)